MFTIAGVGVLVDHRALLRVEELPLEAAEGKEPRHGEEDEEDVEEEEADADAREEAPFHGDSRSLYPTP